MDSIETARKCIDELNNSFWPEVKSDVNVYFSMHKYLKFHSNNRSGKDYRALYDGNLDSHDPTQLQDVRGGNERKNSNSSSNRPNAMTGGQG